MAAWCADDLESPLTELGVDTEFWSSLKLRRLLDEFNELAAQGVHCRFWPGRESGGQLEGDWQSEIVKPELPDPLPQVLRAIESSELSSLERFVVVPMCVADARSREERTDEAFTLYRVALEHAPNPWIQSELGYLFLERAGTQSLPACAAALDKAEVIGRVGEPVPFSDRSAMLDLALQAFGRAWTYTYTPVHALEDEPDPAFDLFTLDGLRVTLLELGHTPGLEAVRDWFWDLVDHGLDARELDYARDLGLLRSFGEIGILVPQGRAQTLEPHVLGQYEEKCARGFGRFWDSLPPAARVLVCDNEYSIAVTTSPTYRDWGGVTMKYCRAIESVLRERLGAKIDEDERVAAALGALFSPTRKTPVEFAWLTLAEFTRLLQEIQKNPSASSVFRGFVAKHAPEKQEFYLSQLAGQLRQVLEDFRKPSAHADPRGPVSKEEMLRLCHMLLPNLGDNHEGLLARLAVFGQR